MNTSRNMPMPPTTLTQGLGNRFAVGVYGPITPALAEIVTRIFFETVQATNSRFSQSLAGKSLVVPAEGNDRVAYIFMAIGCAYDEGDPKAFATAVIETVEGVVDTYEQYVRDDEITDEDLPAVETYRAERGL
jgi:hypothetical protein